jgi:hypothetical protein
LVVYPTDFSFFGENMKRTLSISTIFTVVLLFTTAVFAQPQGLLNRDTTARVEALRTGSLVLHHGKIGPYGGGATTAPQPQQVGGKVLVWSDRKFYLPGEEIKIRAMGLVPDAENLQINVSERFGDGQGNVYASENNPCECGEGNAGYVPSLSSFNFITLVNKKVPSGQFGRYDFTITVSKFPGNNAPAEVYQVTNITVFAIAQVVVENNPIEISQMTMQGTYLFLVGQFPINTPMYFFVGSAPFEGGFSTNPSAVSYDGVTLVLPAFGGLAMEGRVVLMLPDATFSTTSAQTFVPALVTVPQPAQNRQ